MSDYPDFTEYALIDLWTQTLGRLRTRPTYGGAEFLSVMTDADKNDDKILFSKGGEGMIYGGFLFVAASGPISTDKWLIYIDGTLQFDMTFAWIFEYLPYQPISGIPMCTRYDETNYNYGYAIPSGITFETGIEIKYRETYGREPFIFSGFSYALI